MDKDATGADDGTSWANAYVDLAQALLSKQSFNEVWVAEGTYLPGVIKSAFFLLPPSVQVYGRFVGNETIRTQRNGSPTRPFFRVISALKEIPTIIPIMLLFLPKVRPWMDS